MAFVGPRRLVVVVVVNRLAITNYFCESTTGTNANDRHRPSSTSRDDAAAKSSNSLKTRSGHYYFVLRSPHSVVSDPFSDLSLSTKGVEYYKNTWRVAEYRREIAEYGGGERPSYRYCASYFQSHDKIA